MALTLHFVRHGRADDMDGFCIGHTDRPLSVVGRNEIEALARRMQDGSMRCISSDLARARASAERLTVGTVTTDARLREMYFGAWEGQSWADLEATDAERLNRWMTNWAAERTPDGESFSDVIARVRTWIDDLPRDDTPLLVVAHAGSIRAAAVVLLDLPPARAFSMQVDHAHVSSFSLSAHGASLIRWNSRNF